MKQSFEPAYITPTGALISEHDYNFLPDSYKFQCTVYRSEQASEDELWNEVELLACEKRFIESNGPHCPEGFNIWHFITEVKSKFEIRRRQ